MNKLTSSILILLLLFVFSANIQAQGVNWSGPFSFGMSTGVAVYKGDLTDVNKSPWLPYSKDANLAVAGFFAKDMGPISLRFQMNLGGLKAYDFRANQRFSNNFYEYNGTVAININQLLKLSNYQYQGFNFYILGGYGMLRYSSFLTDLSQASLLEEVGYAKIAKASSIIAGGGVKINIVDKINFMAEFTVHLSNADDLDAVIKNGDNDSFQYISLGLSYDLTARARVRGSRRTLRWGNF